MKLVICGDGDALMPVVLDLCSLGCAFDDQLKILACLNKMQSRFCC